MRKYEWHAFNFNFFFNLQNLFAVLKVHNNEHLFMGKKKTILSCCLTIYEYFLFLFLEQNWLSIFLCFFFLVF